MGGIRSVYCKFALRHVNLSRPGGAHHPTSAGMFWFRLRFCFLYFLLACVLRACVKCQCKFATNERGLFAVCWRAAEAYGKFHAACADDAVICSWSSAMGTAQGSILHHSIASGQKYIYWRVPWKTNWTDEMNLKGMQNLNEAGNIQSIPVLYVGLVLFCLAAWF